MPDRMQHVDGTDKWAGSGVGEGGSYNKINWNLAGEERFLLLQFPGPGSPQLDDVSDTFFFWWRGDREDLFSRNFCREEQATRPETYYNNKRVLCSQGWQMEGLLLQPKEVLDVEGNLLCPAALVPLCRGRFLIRSTDTVANMQWALNGSCSKGKQGENVICRKHLRCNPCPRCKSKTKEGTVLWVALHKSLKKKGSHLGYV